MASLVDYNLVRAVQEASQPQRDAMRGLAQTIGEGLGDVGSALVGRQMDVKEKRRQLEAYKQALAQEQGQLMSERDRLRNLIESGPMQPYKKVEAQTNLQNINKRLGEIGSVSETIPEDIGESVRFRTYRDVNPAMLPKRQDAAPDYRDVEMRERQDAAEREAAAAAAAKADADRKWQMQFGQKEREIAATQDRREMEAERKALEDKRKFSLLPPSLENDVKNADTLLDSVEQSLRMIDENRAYIPKATKAAMKANQARREGTWTGDVAAWWAELGSKDVAETEEEKQAVNALLNAIEQVSAPIRSKTFGAVLTPSEEAKAENNLPAPGDEEAELRRKLGVLQELYQLARDRALKKAEVAGYNLEGYQRQSLLPDNKNDGKGNLSPYIARPVEGMFEVKLPKASDLEAAGGVRVE